MFPHPKKTPIDSCQSQNAFVIFGAQKVGSAAYNYQLRWLLFFQLSKVYSFEGAFPNADAGAEIRVRSSRSSPELSPPPPNVLCIQKCRVRTNNRVCFGQKLVAIIFVRPCNGFDL